MKTKQIKKMKVMAVGDVVDSSGKKYTWTFEDFCEIAKNYSFASSEQAAPVLLSHKTESQPRYGYIDKTWVSDGALFCSAQVEEKLFDACAQGFYPNRSISVFPKSKRINHLAILGAEKPAFENLGLAAFSESEEEVASFGFYVETPGGTPPKVEEEAKEEAEKVIADAEKEKLKELVKEVVSEILSGIKSDNSAPGEKSADFAQLQKEKAALEVVVANLQKEKENARKQEAANFSKGLIEGGKIAPNIREAVEFQYLTQLQKGGDALAKFCKTFEDAPAVFSQGLPQAGDKNGGVSVEKAKNYSKEKGVSFMDAVYALTKEKDNES